LAAVLRSHLLLTLRKKWNILKPAAAPAALRTKFGLQQIADRSSATIRQTDFLTVKASINDSTKGGTYAHTLTVIYVGDY
jgi:hypothetical protein